MQIRGLEVAVVGQAIDLFSLPLSASLRLVHGPIPHEPGNRMEVRAR